MPSIIDLGYTHNRTDEILGYNADITNPDITELELLDESLTSQIDNIDQLLAESSVSGSKLAYLEVDKLITGTIWSQQITLGVTEGVGDTYIAAGKTDFTNTESGFILGRDDSDSNLAKFYIGNSTNYLNWDGTTLTIAGSVVAVVSLTAGQDITTGKFVRIYTNGSAYYASAVDSFFNNYTVGVALETASSGASLKVQISQQYITSGLSVGNLYYLGDGTIDQSNSTENTDVPIYSGVATQRGQTFTTSSSLNRIDWIAVYGASVGSGADLYFDIYATSGGVPTGTSLGTTIAQGSGFSTSNAWRVFYFTTPITLSASTMYALVATGTSGSGANYFAWRISTANPYSGGTAINNAGSWVTVAGNDNTFRVGYFTGDYSTAAGTSSQTLGIALSSTQLLMRLN